MCNFQVEDLVSNDKLNVVSEEQVFVAVMDWIKHNPSERSQYIAQVLQQTQTTSIETVAWNTTVLTYTAIHAHAHFFKFFSICSYSLWYYFQIFRFGIGTIQRVSCRDIKLFFSNENLPFSVKLLIRWFYWTFLCIQL